MCSFLQPGAGSETGPVFSLTAKRSELQAHLAALRGDMAVERAAESIEAAMLLGARDAVAQEAHRTQKMLVQVEAALERVRLGTYGFCECGRTISVARLKAVPEAQLCIGCATAKVIA